MRIGEHTANMDRSRAAACQLGVAGTRRRVVRPPLDIGQSPRSSGHSTRVRRSSGRGCSLVGERARVDGEDGLPAASMSSGVGGMGVYWAGSCPRPNASERIPFIPDDEFEALYTRAEQLLSVSKDLHDDDELLAAMRDAVAAEFDRRRPDVTPVGFMPTATSRAGERAATRRAPRRSSARSRTDRRRSSSDPTRSSAASCSTTAPRSGPSCSTAPAARPTRCGPARRGVR